MTTCKSTSSIIAETHPSYKYLVDYYDQMRDTIELGEKQVKDRGEFYLPKTEGQKKAGDGNKRYLAYKNRASYINFGKRTLKKADGLLSSKPYVIEVPEEMESFKNRATVDNESIETLIRLVNRNQMIYSRYGLLVDMPAEVKPDYVPFTVKYDAFSIISWGEELDEEIDENILYFVLLDESGSVFNKQSKTYKYEDSYRLLGLLKDDDGKYKYYSVVLTPEEWKGWDLENPNQDHPEFVIPTLKQKPSPIIPFVFFNATNNTSTPEIPLLYEQSNLSLSYYRGEADYRQAIFLQAFAVLILAGFAEDDLSDGVAIDSFLSSSNPNAKGSYAQVNGQGLMEMRLSQANLKNEAIREGIAVSDKEGVESGKALKTRITMQTSDLSDIAKTCGEGINRILVIIANWMQLPTEDIKVIPNIDFKIETEDFRIITESWKAVTDRGMALRDHYHVLLENNFTKELTFESWLKAEREGYSIIKSSLTNREEEDANNKEEVPENNP